MGRAPPDTGLNVNSIEVHPSRRQPAIGNAIASIALKNDTCRISQHSPGYVGLFRLPCTRSIPHADRSIAATREEMSAAKLPLAYRDSCGHLLIPLNRCRYEEYYLPWKCEVRIDCYELRLSRVAEDTRIRGSRLIKTNAAGREAQLREMPIRRVQEAGGQDERA